MSRLRLDFQEHPRPEDLRLVLDGLYAHNREMTGDEGPRTVAAFLRDEEGRVVGGVQGDFWGRAMHITALWVDENHRGRGYGSKLMRTIEEYAIEHGRPLVYLETTSFQALPFYESLGYQIFGELPEISKGHTLYFLKKELEGMP
jgi:ribosomal protein S18 acetylase RimI-like enzyme